jgi:hypothetical protein
MVLRPAGAVVLRGRGHECARLDGNLEGTGTTICIVDGTLVTSVSPSNSGVVNALNHSGFTTIPGIPFGRYGSKAPRSLYAIKHHVVVEIRVASGATVSKAQLVRLMKLALART